MPDESRNRVSIRNVTSQLCSVCGQMRDPERQEVEGQEMSLLGAHAYACCPSCGRQVPRPWPHDYIRRWHQYGSGDWEGGEADSFGAVNVSVLPARPFPWAFVNGTSETVYLTIIVKGTRYIVRWFRGENPEAETVLDTWDEAVEQANHFRTHLLRRGFRDEE